MIGGAEFKPPVTELTKSLGRLGDDLKNKGFRQAVVAYAGPLKKQIKGRIRSKTGALKRSIGHASMRKADKMSLGYRGDAVVLAVGSTRKVAEPGRLITKRLGYRLSFLDQGTDPHDIPRKRRTGLFRRTKKLKIGGRFVSSVRHPGIRAKYILDKSVSASSGASRQKFNQKLAQFIDKHK